MLPESDLEQVREAARLVVSHGANAQEAVELVTVTDYQAWSQFGVLQALQEAIRAEQKKIRRGARTKTPIGDSATGPRSGMSSVMKAHLLEAAATAGHSVSLRLTREFLNSSFALRNGDRVLWSSATIEEHENAIQMHENNIIGNAVTSALHRKAIERISFAGVGTLGDLPTEDES